MKALGLPIQTQGFSPSKGDEAQRRARLAEVGNEAAELLELDVRLRAEELENTDAYVGENYGIVTEAGIKCTAFAGADRGDFARSGLYE